MNTLIWGQRVTVCDEMHQSFGRVGVYEGFFYYERGLLRVRFPGGVIAAAREQLLPAPEHPVCIARRLKKAGLRPPRVKLALPTPACYTKNYGKTSLELARDALWNAPEDASDEELRRLWSELALLERQMWLHHPPRRITREHVQRRRAPEAVRTRRWLRTRSALRRRAAQAPEFS